MKSLLSNAIISASQFKADVISSRIPMSLQGNDGFITFVEPLCEGNHDVLADSGPHPRPHQEHRNNIDSENTSTSSISSPYSLTG